MTRDDLADEIDRLTGSYDACPEHYEVRAVVLADFLVKHLPTILAALREPNAPEAETSADLEAELKLMRLQYDAVLSEIDESALDRAAEALYDSMRAPHERDWRNEGQWIKDRHRESAMAALRAAREG